MHVISWRKCREFAQQHPEALAPLNTWYQLVKHGDHWNKFTDVRAVFGKTVDRVGECYVFNIHGGSYRLIAKIKKNWKVLYVREIMTHRDYDRGNWKENC